MLPPDWLTSRPIAHRGLHDATAGCPENSLSAFRRAADAGYPIELDVQLSADGEVIVFHDRSLARMTGVDGTVLRTSSQDLARLTLLGSSERVPRLDEVLETIGGRVPLIIELKNSQLRVGRLETAIRKLLKPYTGPTALSSFNTRTVAWFARNLPHLPRGQNIMRFRGGSFWPGGRQRLSVRQLLLNRITRPQFVGCDIGSLPHPTAERLRDRGIPLIVFTVRDREHLHLVKPHADNIFFEGFVP